MSLIDRPQTPSRLTSSHSLQQSLGTLLKTEIQAQRLQIQPWTTDFQSTGYSLINQAELEITGLPCNLVYTPKVIEFERGVCYGDPLSPVLFIPLADLLHNLINHLFALGQVASPIHFKCHNFPIISTQTTHSMMQVNSSKSCFNTYRYSQGRNSALAHVLRCRIGSTQKTENTV